MELVFCNQDCDKQLFRKVHLPNFARKDNTLAFQLAPRGLYMANIA